MESNNDSLERSRIPVQLPEKTKNSVRWTKSRTKSAKVWKLWVFEKSLIGLPGLHSTALIFSIEKYFALWIFMATTIVSKMQSKEQYYSIREMQFTSSTQFSTCSKLLSSWQCLSECSRTQALLCYSWYDQFFSRVEFGGSRTSCPPPPHQS